MITRLQTIRSKVFELGSDLRVLSALIKGRSRDGSHADQLEAFYAPQADAYDSFRERLLPGREDFMRSLPIPAGGVWIDFGGGTGSNLELIEDHIPDFKSIYVVDLTKSLLRICDRRIQNKAWTNVRSVYCDAQCFKPDEATADLVTFSYSLTMMPNWKEVLSHAIQLLKPGGYLGMVDFYLSGPVAATDRPQHHWIKKKFLRRWFAHDQIFLGPERLESAQSQLVSAILFESTAQLPWLPLIQVPWFYFVGQKT